MKIVSLLPSATEIVNVLGCTDRLVGRSHECDYPPQVRQLPICTQPKFDPVGTSGEIHDRVTEVLHSALSVYRVETQILQQLQPTHIITQAQCEVCAVSLADVERAVAQLTGFEPDIISLQPTVLDEVWQDIRRVADCLGVDGEGAVASLQSRVATCRQQVETAPHRPRVATIEWADPLMAAGNWVPELIELAGGQSLFGEVGKHSPWMKWEELQAADPDVIIFMPCGFDLSRTRQDADRLSQHPQWQALRAVRTGRVYLSDGNQYFNRPGPRLVDSLEILAEILHPDRAQFGHQGKGWMQYE
ncbi:MAG: cobalamin-binding protein [Cyanobacteriota bacterium]|nr:cobalamin-binding protein [Cyanobacteriota bacterium]